MKITLIILAVLSAFAGASILMVAKSAIHEILAALLFINAMIAFSASGIIAALKTNNKKIGEDV